MDPSEGDLVLTVNSKQEEVFKKVEVTGQKYSSLTSTGVSIYVPGGFLLLRDFKTGHCSLEPLGTVIGQYNYDVSWLPSLS